MKPLLLGIVLVAAMIVLAVSGASEPQNEPAPGPDVEPLSVDARFEQADTLMGEARHAEAIAAYQQLLAELPVSAKAQQAAFKAARCFDALQQPAEAAGMYERVVAIGIEVLRPRYYKDDATGVVQGGKPGSIKARIETALYARAVACQESGDSAAGLQAIRRLRAMAPNSIYVAKMVPLQLTFEGRPAGLASDLIEREQQAAQLCGRGHEAFWAGQHDSALSLLNRVLDEYPETAACLRAKVDKARILWRQKHYDASHELYKQVLEEIGEVAPDADYARIARCQVAWRQVSKLVKPAQYQARAGELVATETWQQIRQACKVIMELDPDPLKRADANVALIEAYSWEGRHEDVLQAASHFFRNFRGARGGKGRLPRELCWARLFAGDALEHLSRPAEAALHYRAILQAAADHPQLLQDEHVVERATVRLARLGG